jgi:hypothetical protein
MTGLRPPSIEFAQHGFKLHVSRFEENEEVIKEIGCLRTKLFVALADCRNNRFDRFLAELLGASSGAFI